MIAKTRSGFFSSDTKIFQQLLWANQLRGTHGTGIFYDNIDTKTHYFLKDAVSADEFILQKNFQNEMSLVSQKSSFIIGHNRMATMGKHTVENTHPFNKKGITLVHNGTLKSHKHLADVEVDSMAICHALADEHDVEKVINELDGAYALVWYDNKDDCIKIIRNSERPLAWVETKDVLFIASEMGMLEWIVSRNNETIISSGKFEVDYLYEIDTGASFGIGRKKLNITNKNTNKYYYPTTHKSPSTYTHPIKIYPKAPPYIVGDTIDWCPMEVKQSGNSYYLEGLIEDLDKEVKPVRFYHKSKEYLEGLSKQNILMSTISCVVRSQNPIHYTVKNVEYVN